MRNQSNFAARSILFWAGPSLLCLILYWYGLKTWFFQDDFAWVGLLNQVHSWRDLLDAVFRPAAHGTWRPWSERGFFLLFHRLYGLNALPFRIFVFLTQFANLMLLASITRRLTLSWRAGLLAPAFWVANSALVVPMTWTSSYMEILCGFCLLLEFYLLLRYIETNKSRYYWLQVLVFLFGFGVMESNLVYPALAATYTWICARRYFRKTLPLFVVSIAFVIAHMILAPKQASGTYALHFDSTVFVALWAYWKRALVPVDWPSLFHVNPYVPQIVFWIFSAALLGFVAWKTIRRDLLPLLFLVWFFILLSPVVTLTEHVTNYYLTLPTMALAMLAAYAVATGLSARMEWKAIAATLTLLYFLIAAPVVRGATQWTYDHSRKVKTLIVSTMAVQHGHRGKVILLSGIDDLLFWQAIRDGGFRAAGVTDVFLVPEETSMVKPRERNDDIAEFFLTPGATLHALKANQAIVCEWRENRLRDITAEYAAAAPLRLSAGEARRVDVSNPTNQYLLGTGWYPNEGTFRWMGKRATLKIGGPLSVPGKLSISGYCTSTQPPVEIRITADGHELLPAQVKAGAAFHHEFDLPRELSGKQVIEIAVEVDRPLREPGGRELGLVFGTFEVN
jgi:hypothetical protein